MNTTQRTSAEQAQALLAAIAASSSDTIVCKDFAGIVTYWNDAAADLFGFTADEMIGQPITRIIPPDRLDEEAMIVARLRAGERLSHVETERMTKDGRRIPVSLTFSPIRDDAGAIVGISKVARDLSEQRRLRDELLRRGALIESVLDTVPDAIVVIDQAGIVQSFSGAAERMFGYRAQEVTGSNVRILMPSHDAAAHDGYMDRYLATRERRIIGIGRVVVAQHKDGRTFPVELQIGEVVLDGTHLFTGFIRDLTERQERDRRLAELQAELIHVSRLSELGQMVSALAHEVNQPLTAILNYMSGLKRLVGDTGAPALRQTIDRVAEQADRARLIVQSLRTLVKKDSRPRQIEKLSPMIQETSALALIGTNRSVSLQIRIAPEAEQAFIDKVQIQQVLLNLMRNAVEAMSDAPVRRLTVTTARDGGRIAIRVADTGPGLPPQVRARLFQPFVTTKAEGLGVGLSISRAIVEAHGGELTATGAGDEGAEGGGTVFSFTVPMRPDPEPATPILPPPAADPTPAPDPSAG